MNKETLCTGCGATVTQWVDGIWRDETESGYCSESTTLHHPSALPPVAIAPCDEPCNSWCRCKSPSAVAIAPEPQHTPLEKEMLAALKAIHAQLECPARNTTRGNRYREGVLISSDVRQQIKAAISRAEGGKQ